MLDFVQQRSCSTVRLRLYHVVNHSSLPERIACHRLPHTGRVDELAGLVVFGNFVVHNTRQFAEVQPHECGELVGVRTDVEGQVRHLLGDLPKKERGGG